MCDYWPENMDSHTNPLLSRGMTSRHLTSSAPLTAENVSLANLRNNPAWGTSTGLIEAPSSPHVADPEVRASALQDRLKSLLVFELGKDGARAYLHLSVRALYKHVLSAITTPYASEDLDKEASKDDNRDNHKASEAENGDEKQVTFESDDSLPPAPRPTHPKRNSLGDIAEEEITNEKGEVTYRERLGGYLHPRDMRRLVTPFSASNEPELIVRRHVILLNFDPLRAIVLRDRLLVLVPQGADSLLINLEQRVRGGIYFLERSVFGDPSEMSENNIADTERSTKGSSAATGDHRKSVAASLKVSLKDNVVKLQDNVGKLVKKSIGASPGEGTSDSTGSRDKKKGSLVLPKMSIGRKQSTVTTAEEFDEDEGALFDFAAEWEEMQATDWVELPWELQCTDAVLHAVSGILYDDTYQLQETALHYIHLVLNGKHKGLADDPLGVFRHLKDAIREMRSRLNGFVASMNRIIDDHESMALMNVSRLMTHPNRFIKPVSSKELEEEADEPDLLLEAHLQSALTLTNALDLIDGKIETASELVDQKLDSMRNRILLANMIISVFSLCVASASLVGSLFGMNVSNPLEDNGDAFKLITVGSVVGGFIACGLILGILYYTEAIPRMRMYGSA